MKTITVSGLTPEENAFALARYSRSDKSMESIIDEVSEERASSFMNKFVLEYGHNSVKDAAYTTLSFEDISMIAAIDIEDEQLWAGQERSTRYQEFAMSKDAFVVPKELDNTPYDGGNFLRNPIDAEYHNSAVRFITEYRTLLRDIRKILEKDVECPLDMKKSVYESILRARALDMVRGLLPYAVKTSVGQITSARSLEKQLSRLSTNASSEMEEIVDSAIMNLSRKHSLTPNGYNGAVQLPDLLKHVQPSMYQMKIDNIISDVVISLQRQHPRYFQPKPISSSVIMITEQHQYDVEVISSLVYERSHFDYNTILNIIENLSYIERKKILDEIMSSRGPYDDLPRAFQAGQPIQFEIALDGKAMQDFFRHRRMTQLRQGITFLHGFVPFENMPNDLLGLEASTLFEINEKISKDYNQKMSEIKVAKDLDIAGNFTAAQYAIPMGYIRRTVFKMDYAQAAYLIETRTTPHGHQTYRKAAFDMVSALKANGYNDFAKQLRLPPMVNESFLNR